MASFRPDTATASAAAPAQAGAASFDVARMRETVEHLAAIDRRVTRPGERESAEWVADRLRELGASDVRIEPFRSQSSWAHAQVAHQAAGLVAALVGGRRGSALALAAAASMEADSSGRSQWARRLMPAGTGHNVVARLPADGPVQRTLVLMAHHDAAHTGYVWKPKSLERGRRRAVKTGKVPAYHATLLAALGMVATGLWPLRALGAIGLSFGIGVSVEAARSRTAPAANDNATGVAALFELARRFRERPLPGVEVVLVVPSAEEAGTCGTRAWVRTPQAQALDRASTLTICLDVLGSGTPVVVDRDGLTGRYRREDLELVDAGAARAGLPTPPRFGAGAPSDSTIAWQAGLPTVWIASILDGVLARIHTDKDVPDRVDWDCVTDCARLAEATAEAWAQAA